MTELDRMLACLSYKTIDPQLIELRKICRYNLKQFNDGYSKYVDSEQYHKLLKNILPNVHETTLIEQPFYCDYGFNIITEENVFVNYDCKFLDAGRIFIGSNTMIGPNVNIYASTHPNDVESRVNHIGTARPIIIGKNCWIGGNSTICPGVNIGNNVIVGAGSVVTRNVPNNVTVCGNPARIIKRKLELFETEIKP